MANFIVGAIVFILLGLAIYSMFKKGKDSKGSCGCNCSGCSASKSCSGDKLEIKK